MDAIEIYTDGSCKPIYSNKKYGGGGYGAIFVRQGQEYNRIKGFEARTTANRMELMAVIKALESLEHPTCITLYTDSEYVEKNIKRGLPKWEVNGWKTENGEPVKHKELWVRFREASRKHKIHFHWIKSHDQNKYNEIADRFAKEAIEDNRVKIYIDGTYNYNFNLGGYGAVLRRRGKPDKCLFDFKFNTTNRYMELMVVVIALERLECSMYVDFYTHSDYLKTSIVKGIKKWEKNGWNTDEGEPVKYKELWEKFKNLASKHSIKWHWVLSHDHNVHNKKAYSLAHKAIQENSGQNTLDLQEHRRR